MAVERRQIREESSGSTDRAKRRRRRAGKIAVSAGGLAVAAGVVAPVLIPEHSSVHADQNPAHVRLVDNRQPVGLLVNLYQEQVSPLQSNSQTEPYTVDGPQQGPDIARALLAEAGHPNLSDRDPETQVVGASIDALTESNPDLHMLSDRQQLTVPKDALIDQIVESVRGNDSQVNTLADAVVTAVNGQDNPEVGENNAGWNDARDEAQAFLTALLAQTTPSSEDASADSTTSVAATTTPQQTTQEREPRSAAPRQGTEAVVEPVYTVKEGEGLEGLAIRQLEEAGIANPTDQMVFETMALIDALTIPNRDVQDNGGLQVGDQVVLPKDELVHAYFAALTDDRAPFTGPADWLRTENPPEYSVDQSSPYAAQLLDAMAQDGQLVPHDDLEQSAAPTSPATETTIPAPRTTVTTAPQSTTENPVPRPEEQVAPLTDTRIVGEDFNIKILAKQRLVDAGLMDPAYSEGQNQQQDQMISEMVVLMDGLTHQMFNPDANEEVNIDNPSVGDVIVVPTPELTHAFYAALAGAGSEATDAEAADVRDAADDRLPGSVLPFEGTGSEARELLAKMAQDPAFASLLEQPAPTPAPDQTTQPQPTEPAPVEPAPADEPEPVVTPEHRFDVHHVVRGDTLGKVAHTQLHNALGADTETSVTQERANFWTHVAANPQVTNIDLIFADRTNLHTLQDADVRALVEAAEGRGDNQALIAAAGAIKNADTDAERRAAGADVLRALGFGDPHRAEDGDPANHHGTAVDVEPPVAQPTTPETPTADMPELRDDIAITPAEIDGAITDGVLTNETLPADSTVIGEREAQLDTVAGHPVSDETVAAVSRLDQAATLIKYPDSNFRSMPDNTPYVALNDEVAVVIAAASQIDKETREQSTAPEPVKNVLSLIDALGNQGNVPENSASLLDLNVMDLVLRIPGDVPDAIYNQAGAILREQDPVKKQQLAREMLTNPLLLQAFGASAVPPVTGPDRSPNPGDPNLGTEPTTVAPTTPRTTAPETTTSQETTTPQTSSSETTSPQATTSETPPPPTPDVGSQTGDVYTPAERWWDENWNDGDIPRALAAVGIGGALIAGATVFSRRRVRRNEVPAPVVNPELLTPEQLKREYDRIKHNPLTEDEELLEENMLRPDVPFNTFLTREIDEVERMYQMFYDDEMEYRPQLSNLRIQLSQQIINPGEELFYAFRHRTMSIDADGDRTNKPITEFQILPVIPPTAPQA